MAELFCQVSDKVIVELVTGITAPWIYRKFRVFELPQVGAV